MGTHSADWSHISPSISSHSISLVLLLYHVLFEKYEDIEKHGADTLYGDVTPNEQENLIETIRDDSEGRGFPSSTPQHFLQQ